MAPLKWHLSPGVNYRHQHHHHQHHHHRHPQHHHHHQHGHYTLPAPGTLTPSNGMYFSTGGDLGIYSASLTKLDSPITVLEVDRKTQIEGQYKLVVYPTTTAKSFTYGPAVVYFVDKELQAYRVLETGPKPPIALGDFPWYVQPAKTSNIRLHVNNSSSILDEFTIEEVTTETPLTEHMSVNYTPWPSTTASSADYQTALKGLNLQSLLQQASTTDDGAKAGDASPVVEISAPNSDIIITTGGVGYTTLAAAQSWLNPWTPSGSTTNLLFDYVNPCRWAIPGTSNPGDPQCSKSNPKFRLMMNAGANSIVLALEDIYPTTPPSPPIGNGLNTAICPGTDRGYVYSCKKKPVPGYLVYYPGKACWRLYSSMITGSLVLFDPGPLRSCPQ